MASLSTEWSGYRPSESIVFEHWFTVCGVVWVSPHLNLSKDTSPRLCRFTAHRPWPMQKRLSSYDVQSGRSKSSFQVVECITSDWLTIRSFYYVRRTVVDITLTACPENLKIAVNLTAAREVSQKVSGKISYYRKKSCCLLLTSHLGQNWCLVDYCGPPHIACFKDVAAYWIIVNVLVEYEQMFVVYW